MSFLAVKRALWLEHGRMVNHLVAFGVDIRRDFSSDRHASLPNRISSTAFLFDVLETGQPWFPRTMPAPHVFGNQAQYLLNAMHRKHDLSSLVWRTGQHFVRLARFLEWEHGAHLRCQLSAFEHSREYASMIIQARFSGVALPTASDPIGCDGDSTPEVLSRINWTMVPAIPVIGPVQ